MENTTFLCVGGDARQIYTCKALCEYGRVYSYAMSGSIDGVENISCPADMHEKADVLVLPMMTAKGLEINCSDGKKILCSDLCHNLKKNAIVLGGRLTTPVIEYFSALGFDVYDYFKREELIEKNCIPTAEGALQIAMQELGITVNGSRVMIVGYGRVGRVTAALFRHAGADTIVSARRLVRRAQAENAGHKAISTEEIYPFVSSCDVIINTVPALIIDKDILSAVGKDTLIIDLASAPGGVDFEYALGHNKKVIHALGLPGKTSPVTAGKIIAETIVNILRERRKNNVFREM